MEETFACEHLRDFAGLTIAFWIRRFWRIAPSAVLWLVITLCLSIVFNTTRIFGSPIANISELVAFVFQVANFHSSMGLHDSNWSISVFGQFYLIIPFLLFFVPRRYLAWPLVAAVLLQVYEFGVLRLVSRQGIWNRGIGYRRSAGSCEVSRTARRNAPDVSDAVVGFRGLVFRLAWRYCFCVFRHAACRAVSYRARFNSRRIARLAGQLQRWLWTIRRLTSANVGLYRTPRLFDLGGSFSRVRAVF